MPPQNDELRCGHGRGSVLGCLDKGDFLRMMCPDGYRLPSMQGEVPGMQWAAMVTDPTFVHLLTGAKRREWMGC
jgi:hypothetical protein